MSCYPSGGRFGADKNRQGYRGSAKDGGGGGRSISDQSYNLARFMMHGKLNTSRAELAAEKAASNMGRAGGAAPPSPQEGWVGKVEASGEA